MCESIINALNSDIFNVEILSGFKCNKEHAYITCETNNYAVIVLHHDL